MIRSLATARTVLFTPGNRPGRFAEVVCRTTLSGGAYASFGSALAGQAASWRDAG